MKILLVDDTKTERLLMTAYLQKLGHDVVIGENGKEAIDLYTSQQPDLILMDVIMPEIDGHQAAREIRKNNIDWIPIIFLSGKVSPDDIAAGIEAGGDDYLTKPVDYIVLEAKMKAMQRISGMRRRLLKVTGELEKANHELSQLANVDGLTGLANRRYMDNYLRIEISRAVRNQQFLGVILTDVDSFKPFNDNYGHLEGDDCLKKIASTLDEVCKRSTDLVARYGGEEFAIILPDTSPEKAMSMAENMRTAVAALKIPHAYSSASNVCTLSFGVYCCVPDQKTNVEHMLVKADAALYQAKKAGRNQTQYFDEADSA